MILNSYRFLCRWCTSFVSLKFHSGFSTQRLCLHCVIILRVRAVQSRVSLAPITAILPAPPSTCREASFQISLQLCCKTRSSYWVSSLYLQFPSLFLSLISLYPPLFSLIMVFSFLWSNSVRHSFSSASTVVRWGGSLFLLSCSYGTIVKDLRR